MKNYKLAVLGLVLILTIVSCKKEDIQKTNTDSQAISSSGTIQTAKWISINNWSLSTTENAATYFSKMSDTLIANEVAKSGLVLVYMKTGNEIQSLPFEEKDTKTFWYYQVSKGSIIINSDNNDGKNLNQHSFSYIIITPEQLSTLEASGKTKFDLMQLSYKEAAYVLH
jgi:hypothetical protein